MNFSYIYLPTRWGFWGILEHQWQKLEQAPKYQAIQDEILYAK